VAFGPPATAAAPQTGPPQMPLPPAKPPDTAALAPAPARRHLRIRGTRWKVILLSVGLAVFVGGLLGGYQWTQTQYYVGAQGNHVALYQGVNDSVLGISLSKVLRDHPEIELKYLPPYQQKQVQATIAEDSKSQGQSKVDDLAVQASACKKEARRQNGDNQVTLTEEEQKLVSLCSSQ
jgi:protein phosphatase